MPFTVLSLTVGDIFDIRLVHRGSGWGSSFSSSSIRYLGALAVLVIGVLTHPSYDPETEIERAVTISVVVVLGSPF